MCLPEQNPREVVELAEEIRQQVEREPRFFSEIVRMVPPGKHRTLLRAWGLLRRRGELSIDADGRYSLTGHDV